MSRSFSHTRPSNRSRSAARGHAKLGEASASGTLTKFDDRISEGLAKIVTGESLTGTARSLGVSRERLRRALAERGDYVRRGRRHVFVPRLSNDLPLYSRGASIRVRVDDENASRLGSFMAAVKRYLRSNRPEHLAPFAGEGVTDIGGKFHPFEADPEALYALDARGRPDFLKNYQQPNGRM